MPPDRSKAGVNRDRLQDQRLFRRAVEAAIPENVATEESVAAAIAEGTAPPSGTGFRHITAGGEDAAAKLVETADVAAANKDGTAGTPSMRTLGTGAQQACAGNDARLAGATTTYDQSAFTVATGNFRIVADELRISGTNEVAVEGDATLAIIG